MTALVVEKSRQVGLTFAERLERAVQLLGEETYGMGKHLLIAYATARILGEDPREAILRAHWGKNVREPAADWNLAVLERYGDEWVARLDAAVERIREKAARP
jgi:hypothetical protein